MFYKYVKQTEKKPTDKLTILANYNLNDQSNLTMGKFLISLLVYKFNLAGARLPLCPSEISIPFFKLSLGKF